MELTYSELLWLRQHGGREEMDINFDEKGFYVYMSSKGIYVKVYLPKKSELSKLKVNK